MTQMDRLPEVTVVREDDHYIEFSDTRGFAADKWRTAVEAQEITNADRIRARGYDNYEEYNKYVRQTIIDSRTAQQRSYVQSLLLVTRPVALFNYAFEKLVSPEYVDMSVIWCLLYLNISSALQQPGKLKQMTSWLSTFKRTVEALNQCIENCADKNTARTQATDIFDPLLGLLTGLLRFQRTYVQEVVFMRDLSHMRDFVKQHIDEMDNVVYHFRQISQHTRDLQELHENRSTFRGLPFRDLKGNPYDKAAFPVDNLPDIRTDPFYGREDALANIHTRLGNFDKKQLRTYLIYGLRGVGKTQIALRYAELYKAQYDAIFWVRCETGGALRQSFSDIAVALDLSTPDKHTRPEENQMKVLEWLKKTSKSWLLIYDNAEREQSLNAYWPREGTGAILLTSRSYYNFEHAERRDGETVPVFSTNERWELLMALLGSEWQQRHLDGQDAAKEKQAARKLLELLGGLALAIAQIASIVLERNIAKGRSIVAILELFEETSRSLPPRLFGHRSDKIHALDTVMAIALNHVSQDARSLLGTFALLAPDEIPIDLFLPVDQSRLNGRLEFCKQDQGGKSATEMSAAMAAAVEELLQAQLIRQDGRAFVIHRVVQEAMNYQSIEDLQSIFSATVELLHEAFPKQALGRPLIGEWSQCQMFVQHVVHLTKAWSIQQKGRREKLKSTFNFIQLLSNCGWYLYEVADYIECIDMMNIACAASDEKRTLLYSHLLNTLGAAYYERNQMRRAKAYFLEAKELREIHLPPDHIQQATALSNLGNVETSDGNLEEARVLFEEAARIKDSHGETEVVSLGMSFLQLGRVAALQDDPYVAMRRFDRAEACWIKHPLQSKQFMAYLHYERGNVELNRPELRQAIVHFERCRDLCHRNSPGHPLAAAAFYKLALCDIARGSRYHERALVNLEKAFNVATLRSGGEIDGVVARINWKRAEIMVDDPIQREKGLKIRDSLKLDLREIATDLNVVLQPEWTDDEAFNRLVSGYFR